MMKRTMQKWLAVVLAVLLLVGMLPISALAQADGVYIAPVEEPVLYAAPKTRQASADPLGLEQMRGYLFEQLKACPDRVDISAYAIPYTEANLGLVRDFIWTGMPEAFHVHGIGASVSGSVITSLTFSYWVSDSALVTQMNGQLETAAAMLLAGVEGNAQLSEVEKALLLHDRLALWNEYDYTNLWADTVPRESYTAYGALVNKTSVCQGYAMAYAYLLNRVGIKNAYCRSAQLNHGWNIVYIGGVPYHVDVTWDDPLTIRGAVDHDNFLISTQECIATGHDATDYDLSPVDTTYDAWFWENSFAAFQLVGENELYFIDYYDDDIAQKQTLKSYIDGNVEEVTDVTSRWQDPNSGGYWPPQYARLAAVGDMLLYSGGDGVYRYELATGRKAPAYLPAEAEGKPVYGFDFIDGYMVCNLADSPNAYLNTPQHYKNYLTVRQVFDTRPPSGAIGTTGAMGSIRNAELTLSDNMGIRGYYWGTSPVYHDNPFILTSSYSAHRDVSTPGTYYLTVQDLAGNLSETVSAEFGFVTVDANGGEIFSESSAQVMILSGESIQMAATRDGYAFNGWSLSSTAEDGVGSICVPLNGTCYAVWVKGDVAPSYISIKTEPSKTVYSIGEAPDMTGLSIWLHYTDQSKEAISSGWSISGFDSTSSGRKPVTVTYREKTTQFYVGVRPAAPPAPTVRSMSDTAIELTPTAGYEYQYAGGAWQTSNVFTGLTPGRTYTFYQRVAESATSHASLPSEGLPVVYRPVIRGTCGDGLQWVFDMTTGQLTVSGLGEMEDYSDENNPSAMAPWRAFAHQIKAVELQEGVASVGSCAFLGCTDLESVQFSAGLFSIGYRAFEGCGMLRSVNLPESCMAIAGYAFSGCRLLTDVTAPGTLFAIGVDAFAGTAWFDRQPNGMVYVGNVLYKYKGNGGAVSDFDITVREGTLGIADSAFGMSSWLLSVSLPDSLLYIGEGAFELCDALCRVNLPNGLLSIGADAFYGCSYLAEVEIPDNVLYVGSFAYSACERLTRVSVGRGVELVDMYAFKDNRLLEEVVFLDRDMVIEEGAFEGCYRVSLHGYAGSTAEAYAAENGLSFVTLADLPDGLNCINGEWLNFKNGRVDIAYTGLVQYNGMWFYVRNGAVDWNAETLVEYSGMWFYVKGGMVGWNAETLCYYNGGWFYVKGGMIDWNAETLVQYNGMWFYVRGGMVDWNTETLVQYNGMWFYIHGGMVDWNAETLCYYNGGWFYVKGGMIDWGCNTLCLYNGAWYYVTGGSVNWGYSGYVPYYGAWYRVVGGVVRF